MCLQDRGACGGLQMASLRARVTGHPFTLPLGVPELTLSRMHQQKAGGLVKILIYKALLQGGYDLSQIPPLFCHLETSRNSVNKPTGTLSQGADPESWSF